MLPAVEKTYALHLVQPDATSAGRYVSPGGRLPNVGDIIEVDEHGGRARVTDVWPDDDPPTIRAELFTE
jgi:hypothetical protein